jgi:hypothetical protein
MERPDRTMAFDEDSLRRGARNLLEDCSGARPGESLLIVHEDESLGYYGPGLADAVSREADALGLRVSRRRVPFSPEADSLPDDLALAVTSADHTLFLARLGDQLRFQAMPAGSRAIVSYALDREALASSFGAAPHAAFVALKHAFDDLWAKARRIRVTCPLGTSFEGAVAPAAPDRAGDVSIKRFPMPVFAPLAASGFRGRVVVAHLLCGTGSRYYQPFGLRLDAPLVAVIDGGRLLRWEGKAGDVARAEAHYAQVAGRYGIDGGFIHSWHAGIHPGCAYIGSAHDDYERWSGSAFGNPRLLHFHTCGAYAPGEICWNVVDATVEADGATVYDAGRIRLEAVPGAGAIVAAHPGLKALFDNPDRRIGLPDAGGRA